MFGAKIKIHLLKTIIMKPARNIKELYRNLNPFFIPQKGRDDNIYVPIYDSILKRIKTQILVGDYNKETFFLASPVQENLRL
ncbi:MAG: hypothetical protein HY738_12265 [Bacteroidia bacterium]|nr:hypothetical protein [Bacteroidia bacterium]